MVSCAVVGCKSRNDGKNRKQENITYHRYPKGGPLLNKWLSATGRRNWSPKIHTRICSKHFEKHCFHRTQQKVVLNKSSVPTLSVHPLMEIIKMEPEVAACRACLATDARLYDVTECGLLEAFVELTSIPVSALNGLRHLCVLCCSELSKYAAFRDRCQRAHELLATLQEWGPLKMDDIRAIDRDSHKLTRNLVTTEVEIVVTNEMESILPTPLKTEEGDNESVCTKYEESEYSYETMLTEVELINDSEIKEEVKQNKTTTLKKRKILGSSEVSTKVTEIDTGNTEDIVKQEKKPTLKKRKTCSSEVSTEVTETDTGNTEDIEKQETKPATLKKRKTCSSEVSTKVTEIDTGNTEDIEKQETKPALKKRIYSKRSRSKRKKRIKIGDEFYPYFDYKAFETEFKVKIKLLSKDEQKAEVEARKLTSNYLNSTHRCDICGKGFLFSTPLTNHMLNHDPSTGPFECEICHLRFPTRRKQMKHHLLHRVKFTCQECGFVSRVRNAARNHFGIHAGKTYKCPHCPREFDRPASRYNHARIAHPGRNVACDLCGETFLSAKGVHLHKNLAHRENTKQQDFKCPTCDVTFNSLEALDKHTSTAPDSHTIVTPCAVCGENCESEAALSEHTALRHPPDQYRCHECDATFSSAAAFETHHRRKHLGVRRPQQPYRYRAAGGRRPARAGRGPAAPNAKLVCEICGKIVKSETALKLHRRTHDRPFKCTQCPKAFGSKNARDWHLRTHTGERPYRCDLCPRAFALENNLTRHHKVVHLNQRKRIPCPLCGRTLTTNSCLKVHINTVHNHMPGPKRKRRKKEPDYKESDKVSDVNIKQ